VDLNILLSLQQLRESLGSNWTSFFQKMTFLGEISTALFLMASIYWCVDKELGAYLLSGWQWNRLVNGLLKVSVCAYRPWIRDARIIPDATVKTTATGYSFPSGHSTNAGTLFGGIGVYRKSTTGLRLVCFIILLLVAFSRIYLGVHTPQDVLVGIAYSVLVMVFTGFIMKRVNATKNGDILMAVLSVAVSIGIALFASLKSYPVDYDAEGKILVDGAKMANDTFKSVGLCIGFFTGFVLERRFVHFTVEGTVAQKGLRLLCGLLILYFVHFVLCGEMRKWIPGATGIVLSNIIPTFYVVFLYPWLVQNVEKRQARKA